VTKGVAGPRDRGRGALVLSARSGQSRAEVRRRVVRRRTSRSGFAHNLCTSSSTGVDNSTDRVVTHVVTLWVRLWAVRLVGRRVPL
jgi:hypothetical protein